MTKNADDRLRFRGAGLSVFFIIFGAAVRPDGTASTTLESRVDNALMLARNTPNRMFVATGGVGRYGLAEAHIIRDRLVAGGVDPADILVEDRATDTLESVIYCDRILRGREDVELLVPCSSGYHNPRCGLLLRILGYRVRMARVPSDLRFLGGRTWMLYVLKEVLALPYDAMLLLIKRVGGFMRSDYRRGPADRA
jgi:uncharacterized SAM-binding protein YcdF (DUF218 family)